MSDTDQTTDDPIAETERALRQVFFWTAMFAALGVTALAGVLWVIRGAGCNA